VLALIENSLKNQIDQYVAKEESKDFMQFQIEELKRNLEHKDS
jgi:hypothetical protein